MFVNFRALCLGALLAAGYGSAAARGADQNPMSGTETIDLAQAVALAVQNDPGIAGSRREAEAQSAAAIADAQWADPTVRIGVANLPTDSLAFDQQPMTQKVIGIRQQLPRGDSARLAGERGALRAESGFARSDDRERQLVRDVSRTFMTLAEQLRTRDLLQQNRARLAELVSYNRTRLAETQIQSQQLLQSQLAVARVDDRIVAVDGDIHTTRSELSRWLGAAAWRHIDRSLPHWARLEQWLTSVSLPIQADAIAGHPALLAAEAEVSARGAEVALAREAYKPQWSLEVSYGQRELTPLSDGSDLASATVSFDLPLFTGKRQDKRLASAQAREGAGILARQNLQLALLAGLNAAATNAHSLAQRRQLYQHSLLDEAEATAAAVLRGYASDTTDLDAVIDARLDVIEAQINAVRLDYGYYRALAQVRYFLAQTQVPASK
ncbi:TolC family protein [Microbulbifer sp. TYP-18]|uniref:TolC family protein n=1 Tax=Microbulbifer sp. TYP-18 TaxID=3230024 RepID=UPI0034C6724C